MKSSQCSLTCEHLNAQGVPCGDKTEFAYRAQRGWMALCGAHAQRHRAYSLTVEIAGGIATVEEEESSPPVQGERGEKS